MIKPALPGGASRALGKGSARRWMVRLGVLFACALAAVAAADSPGLKQPEVLTNVQQVVELDRARARQGDVPVRLGGVLTYPAMDYAGWFFVQDESAATLVVLAVPPFHLVSGQNVEIEGTVGEGIWAPYVQAHSMRQFGTAALPAPKHTPPAQLAAGADFGRWMEIEVTVRDAAISKNRLLLICAENGLHFQAWAKLGGDMALPVDLLDARVRLQGIAWTSGGYDRRPTGFRFHVPSTNYIEVLKAGCGDIFSRSSREIQSLRRFAGDRNVREKVTGVVTLHSPAGWLYLQDQTGGLLAWQLSPYSHDLTPNGHFLKREQGPLHPGDKIELVGAPLLERPFAPVLEDAEYRLIGHTSPPPARLLSSAEVLSAQHDAELVTIKARVVDIESHRELDRFEEKVWVQTGNATFEASLETAERTPLPVRKDDFVALTGVCSIEPGQYQQVRAVHLHLRSLGDIVITRPPPWWTSRWALAMLSGSAATLLAGVAWILVLRHRIAIRTAELSSANKRLQAEVVERKEAQAHLRTALDQQTELNRLKTNFVSMVSHEIRTPLALILSSSDILARYLERLSAEKRQRHLDTISGSVTRMAELLEDVLLVSRAEAGRMDFKPGPLEVGEFCRRLVLEIDLATRQRCPIQLDMPQTELAGCADEALLRHILTNLLTNAIKYSRPGSPVRLEVGRSDGEAIFRVQDRGLGIPQQDRKQLFTPFYRGGNVATIAGTGLGLVIVRHCVERHGGRLDLQSSEGVGTTVTVHLPLFSLIDSNLLNHLKQPQPTTPV